MTKWSWKLRFFAVFLASAMTLLLTGATWLAVEAFTLGPLVGTVVVIAEICFGSFILWMFAEEES
jgi:hypothetical protein